MYYIQYISTTQQWIQMHLNFYTDHRRSPTYFIKQNSRKTETEGLGNRELDFAPSVWATDRLRISKDIASLASSQEAQVSFRK